MNNLTLISSSYNTPKITANMLKSFLHFHPNQKILISENSSNEDTKNILKGYNIPFINNPRGLHSPSVDLLLSSIDTSYALLMDTDVLLLKNLEPLYNAFVKNDLTLYGEIVGDRGGKKLHTRVNPWFCFINVDNIKKYKIKFHDEIRLKKKEEIRYDVGSSFFEDVKKQKLKIGEIAAKEKYYMHFEGMSWRTLRYKEQLLDGDIDNNPEDYHNNRGLYEYGLFVEKQYDIFLAKCNFNPIKYNPH